VTDLKYQPVIHSHKEMLERAMKRPGFKEASVASQMLKARSKAGLTQDAVAELMGTSKSAVSRLEGVGKHAPSLSTLKKYAKAVGCDLQIKFVPQRTA
jgi:transcriptional regulator with XRE-family HTH domain